jgi:Haem degrading protein HbpS-like
LFIVAVKGLESPMLPLTLAQASTIVDTALKTGREHKFMPLSVAVLDAGGHLVAFKREDKSGILLRSASRATLPITMRYVPLRAFRPPASRPIPARSRPDRSQVIRNAVD